MLLFNIEKISFLGGWSFHILLWTATIVATSLLLLFLIYTVFSEEPESEKSTRKRIVTFFDTKNILLFFTAFCWISVLSSYFALSVNEILIIGGFGGILIVFISLILLKWKRSHRANREVLPSTGRVSKSIPPHRNGIGKVYLNKSRVPLQLDAITIGQELPVGVPVRIVDMLDEHTAVVEPLENGGNRMGNKENAPI